MRVLNLAMAAIAAASLAFAAAPASAAAHSTRTSGGDTYTEPEIVRAVSDFFGVTSAAAAKAVETVFAKYGRPNGYIVGSEGSGAVVVGVRYGEGDLFFRHHRAQHVFWQGPSVGFDVGANASKCFTLVYNLPSADAIYQRYPGVEGSYYFIAGIGINYQQSGHTILAPMRTGVGVRAGVNAGYLSYSRSRSWVPLW
jgi:hypothetical protein